MIAAVMEDMGKNLGIRLITDISGVITGHQKFPDGHKGGVFTIGHGRNALDEKGVTGIDINGVVGILPSLRKHGPGLKFLAVQTEIFRNGSRIADFFQHDDIGPEAENHDGLVFFAHLAQGQTAQHQTKLPLRLTEFGPLGRIAVDTNHIIGPLRGSRRGFLARSNGKFIFDIEIKLLHIGIKTLDTGIGKDARQDG